MAILQVVVTMPKIGGTPEDDSHNTFVFEGVGSVTAIADQAFTAVSGFYNTAHSGGTNPVSFWLGSQIKRTGDNIMYQAYDITGHLDGSPHGSPVRVAHDTWSVGAGGASAVGLPEGCAVCLSYHSAYGSDVEKSGAIDTAIPTDRRARNEGAPATHSGHDHPRARDRGRIYLGPLDRLILAQDATTKRLSVGPQPRLDIAAAGEYLISADIEGSVALAWKVWSRRRAAVDDVVGGWVDDRIDYQRRREDQGLVRTEFSATLP